MKDLENFLKILSEGMKSVAKGLESVADKVEAMAHAEMAEKSPRGKSAGAKGRKKARKKPAKKAAAPKAAPKTVKKDAPKKTKPPTATDTVYRIISRSKNGVDTETLKKKTGFPAKKIHNIMYKLRKQGKIKSKEKGIYVKA